MSKTPTDAKLRTNDRMKWIKGRGVEPTDDEVREWTTGWNMGYATRKALDKENIDDSS